MSSRSLMTVFILSTTNSQIKTLVEKTNIRIWTSVNDVPSYQLKNSSLSALERVDGIILEITEPTPDIQFVLAQAIILQKPTLCLYEKNREPREMLTHLAKKTVPKFIKPKAYTTNSLESAVGVFLATLTPRSGIHETPSIKFTLRLTPSLEKYLEWLAKERDANKAEYIRKLIARELEQDEKYNDILYSR